MTGDAPVSESKAIAISLSAQHVHPISQQQGSHESIALCIKRRQHISLQRRPLHTQSGSK